KRFLLKSNEYGMKRFSQHCNENCTKRFLLKSNEYGMIRLCYIAAMLLLVVACKKDTPENDPLTPGNSFRMDISTDKACYAPGDFITFNLNKTPPPGTRVRYKR